VKPEEKEDRRGKHLEELTDDPSSELLHIVLAGDLENDEPSLLHLDEAGT
jgi:hypothetical protein